MTEAQIMRICRKHLMAYPYGCYAEAVIFFQSGHQNFYVEINAPDGWCYDNFHSLVTKVFLTDPANVSHHQYRIVRR